MGITYNALIMGIISLKITIQCILILFVWERNLYTFNPGLLKSMCTNKRCVVGVLGICFTSVERYLQESETSGHLEIGPVQDTEIAIKNCLYP